MSEILKLATVVVYADDAPATYYDADLGFALLGGGADRGDRIARGRDADARRTAMASAEQPSAGD